jgi:hypothetical protein
MLSPTHQQGEGKAPISCDRCSTGGSASAGPADAHNKPCEVLTGASRGQTRSPETSNSPLFGYLKGIAHQIILQCRVFAHKRGRSASTGVNLPGVVGATATLAPAARVRSRPALALTWPQVTGACAHSREGIRAPSTPVDASATRRRATSDRCPNGRIGTRLAALMKARHPQRTQLFRLREPLRLASGPGGPGATQEWKVALPMLFVHANRRTCSTVRLSAGEGSCKSARWRLRLPHS